MSSKPLKTFRLNNGDVLSAVGVGCWMGRQGEGPHVVNMVKAALKLGYRHIDTGTDRLQTTRVGTEVSVGQGIRESGVPRSEIYVTTKLASEDHWDPLSALETSLAKLQLDYVDMYLMHWPMALRADGSALPPDESPTFLETWWAMQEILKTGKTRAIGVSNLSEKHLSSLLDHPKTTVVPAVNQLEIHPCLPQHRLLEFCRSRGILLVAYSPIGKHKFADDPDIQAISKRLNVSPARVILSWAVQRGTAVIPKSEHEVRLAENMSIIELSDGDMLILDRIHKKPGMHRSVCGFHSPELGGSCFGWTYEQLGWQFQPGAIMPE